MTAFIRRGLALIADPVSSTIGVGAMKIAISIVFVWIGALKFVPYEADSITPFVANNPFLSFFYEHPDDYKGHLTHEGELKPAERAWQGTLDTCSSSSRLGTWQRPVAMPNLPRLLPRRHQLVRAVPADNTPHL